MKSPCKIVVAGVGLIGKRHVEIVRSATNHVVLSAIVDPSHEGEKYAKSMGVNWYSTLKEMFQECTPDGVIIATPNQVHVENGLECVVANCPMLVEKPIATSSEEAQQLVSAAKANNVPLLVGHHRRHNPLIKKAKSLINQGRIGRVTAVHSTCWFLKPDEYYTPEWRRKLGAGPVMVNAIHDIDLLRYLCGEIVSVQAISSNVTRGFEVEDTAVALLKFQSGVLGTLTLSDAIASPWSWEASSGENSDFPATPESCYMIGGTTGSLSVPDLRSWQHEGEGHWKEPISATSFYKHNIDPLMEQISNFANVIRGEEQPLVSGEEGLKSLKVIEAIKQSAMAEETIYLTNS